MGYQRRAFLSRKRKVWPNQGIEYGSTGGCTTPSLVLMARWYAILVYTRVKHTSDKQAPMIRRAALPNGLVYDRSMIWSLMVVALTALLNTLCRLWPSSQDHTDAAQNGDPRRKRYRAKSRSVKCCKAKRYDPRDQSLLVIVEADLQTHPVSVWMFINNCSECCEEVRGSAEFIPVEGARMR